MFGKRIDYIRKMEVSAVAILTLGLLTACGQNQSINTSIEVTDTISRVENDVVVSDEKKDELLDSEDIKKDTTKDSKDNIQTEELKEMFGDKCIVEQTFEVELSEYSEKVYFVPFSSTEENGEFTMKIFQDGKVLTTIQAYVPEVLVNEEFSSLDAVSFWDVNFDGNTDVVSIQTYGNTSFAAVYYGFSADAEESERYFLSQEQLSENITSQVGTLTIPEIKNFLSDGKKNGSFSSYKEAYKAVSKLCEQENLDEKKYDLIYFDEDDTPELVAGVDGYYRSMYTYHDGTVYALMNQWSYGAGGNAGYEYSPRRNSLRNYNNDYAGVILYTTYMTINEQYSLETVATIKTLNFDDVNGNEVPDEGEEGSVGNYSVSYMNGAEVTEEDYAQYDQGGYEYIKVTMHLDDLKSELE